ncbi:hypothetical protein PPTG_01108 [Phytophthora nicotianae INRA-310]|uniref:BZIP domain-containing protein n=1 Tax=Phytophthora nicotianae (strain INRA-310) TaxID=761204 RepID=W2RHQ4_PHYN3|nr:hypothetical protein PPTG_01108 [Phytophthora nicotianae INRA-310]ETN24948.1 hypothetical protein PPTG_01108 [Phytophthora nicotianae INRA-310]
MVDADEFDLLTTERDPPPTRDEIRKLPQELKKMRKLELHRKRMSRFRGRRAVEKKNMHEEFHRLLEQRLVNLRCSSVCGGPERITKVQRQLQQLVLEREWFRSESETLRQNLARFVGSRYGLVFCWVGTSTTAKPPWERMVIRSCPM